MKNKNLLLELGVEELPIKKLKILCNSFAILMRNNLQHEKISYEKIKCFITPRRICLRVLNLKIQKTTILISGPKLNIAYSSSGKPTKAVLGFLKSNKVNLNRLKIKEKKNGVWLIYEKNQINEDINKILSSILKNIILSMSKIDSMHYSDPVLFFVRPIRWINFIFNNEVIKANIFNLTCNNKTYGHRFHANKSLVIENDEKYEYYLKSLFVIACYNKRRKNISDLIYSYCNNKYFNPIIDEKILNELSGITEYPSILIGSINKELINLPKEILVSVIQIQQKCIPLINKKNNKIIDKFIIISNLKIKYNTNIILGYEKVMHSRLKDAYFHYNEDLNKSLKKRILNLNQIIFYKNLGSVLDKIKRLISNIKYLSGKIFFIKKKSIRFAILSKNDLTTNLVSEFPELQGIVSGYYTKYFGEIENISSSLKNQYFPKSADEKTPLTNLEISFCIADLTDNLCCLFKIKNVNSDKDPYALRRKALGLMKILIDNKINIDLDKIFNTRIYLILNYIKEEDIALLVNFCKNRLKIFFLNKNVPKNIINAVISSNNLNPYDIHLKIKSSSFFFLSEKSNLVINLYKRINNFLSKNNIKDYSKKKINAIYKKNISERNLETEIKELEKKLSDNINYDQYFFLINKLSNTLEIFFKENIILSKNNIILENRITLLIKAKWIFNYVINMDYI